MVVPSAAGHVNVGCIAINPSRLKVPVPRGEQFHHDHQEREVVAWQALHDRFRIRVDLQLATQDA